MNRLTCCLLAMFASVGLVSARSHYATAYNQFRSLTAVLSSQPKAHVSCALDGNCLDLRNASAIPLVATDTTLTANTGYSYLVRASSHSSQAGRSYTVTDADGNKSRVEGTSWGIVFDYTDSAHYHRVEVSCSNSNLYDDLTDQRTMHVSIYRHDGSSETLLSRRTLSDGVDMEDGLNTLMVSVANGQAAISVGKKRLQPVATVALDDVDSKTVKTGLYLSPGAHIAIERTVLTTESNPPRRVATCWTREALDQHLAMSSDPIEGYWQYQDRDMEDQWLRLGGRYTVAVVAANDGYDIIYLSGAQVNAAQWQAGLLKGHITKTIFDGNYGLEWIDATFQPIVQDAYATFENGVLMTLDFPVYESQVRLSKVLQP